jgi:hypothetical protein
LSTSPICQARRSRSRSSVSPRARASASAAARPRQACHRRGQRGGVGAGLLVEQRAHGGRPRQALPGVLAVDVDQLLGGLAQLRHGGRAAVDPGAALALRIDAAAQQQLSSGRSKPASSSQGLSAGGVSNSALTSARAQPSRTSRRRRGRPAPAAAHRSGSTCRRRSRR